MRQMSRNREGSQTHMTRLQIIEITDVRPGMLISLCPDPEHGPKKREDFTRVRTVEYNRHLTELHVNDNECYTVPVWLRILPTPCCVWPSHCNQHHEKTSKETKEAIAQSIRAYAHYLS